MNIHSSINSILAERSIAVNPYH